MSKIKFRSSIDGDTGKYVSEPGSPLLAQYAMKVDEKTGYEYLAPTGEYTNVHDKIQADYPSTDINILMQRFALGETEAINIKEGFYADVRKMPTTYAELFAMNQESINVFEKLPTDIKEMFNNSYTEFWSAFGTEEFEKKIATYNSRFELSPEYDEKFENNESEVK